MVMGLRLKLLLPFVLLLATVFLYSNLFMVPQYVQLVKANKIKEESTYVDLLSTALLPDLLESDLANVYATLDRVLGERKHWYTLTLFNSEGERLYPLVERALPQDLELDALDKNFDFNGQRQASVQLMLDVNSTITEEVDYIKRLEVSVLLTLFILLILVSFFLDGYIRRPLVKLAGVADRIARGNYGAEINISSSDEVGQLSQSLEQMRSKIQERESAMNYFADIQDVVRLVQNKFIADQDVRHVFLELQRRILILTESEAGVIGELIQEADRSPYLQPFSQNEVVRTSQSKVVVFSHGATHHRLDDMNTLLGEVMASGQPVIDEGPTIAAERLGFAVADTVECRNFVGLPLYSGFEFVGVLCLVNCDNGVDLGLFDELEVLLQTLAQLIVAYRERKTLVDNESRLRMVIDNAVEGIISTDASGFITSFNAAAERIFGYSHDQVIGRSVSILVPQDQMDKHHKAVHEHFLSQDAKQINSEFETEGRHRRGNTIPLELSVAKVTNPSGTQYTGIVRDITERKQHEEALNKAYADLQAAHEKLEEQNRLDGLTGLANRRFFDETLSKSWKTAMRDIQGSTISIVLCDIDYFKKYNDTYGHPEGDACLKSVASALASSFTRETDLVARYGGEEFVVILPGVNEEQGLLQAERMRESVWELNREHSASEFQQVSISVGVTTVNPMDWISQEEAISQADQALYRAKEQGRNRVIQFSSL